MNRCFSCRGSRRLSGFRRSLWRRRPCWRRCGSVSALLHLSGGQCLIWFHLQAAIGEIDLRLQSNLGMAIFSVRSLRPCLLRHLLSWVSPGAETARAGLWQQVSFGVNFDLDHLCSKNEGSLLSGTNFCPVFSFLGIGQRRTQELLYALAQREEAGGSLAFPASSCPRRGLHLSPRSQPG